MGDEDGCVDFEEKRGFAGFGFGRGCRVGVEAGFLTLRIGRIPSLFIQVERMCLYESPGFRQTDD